MNKFYLTGIGSRKLLREDYPVICRDIKKIIAAVADFAILRSGGAEGADSAFELAAYYNGMAMEIFVPWNGFNGRWSSQQDGIYSNLENEAGAEAIAQDFHPNWKALSPGAKKLMTRNTYQVLGQDLQTPSSCVLCFTPDGKGGGGTGQALRIAKAYRIPIYDFGKEPSDPQTVLDWISSQ